MTVLSNMKSSTKLRGYVNQLIMIFLMYVPAISFGLAMGWVSLASGGGADTSQGGELVGAATITFIAALVGVPLSARAVAEGRKFAVIITSAAFVICWGLKMVGDGWWVVAARCAAGFGGSSAWTVSPLLAREMCEKRIRGAAVSALVLAHNLGFLLMYLAADAAISHRTILWWCLGLSGVHCVVFVFVPESPSYLAANGKSEAARASLAWLRGTDKNDPSLKQELEDLPLPEDPVQSPVKLTRQMLSDVRRRRAFIISSIAVIGQEACGVLALLQFAERVFVLAQEHEPSVAVGTVMSPARHAVVLGAVQLIASAFALYLVERVGRRGLLVSTSFVTALGLGAAAGGVCAGGGAGQAAAALALAVVVGADSAGMQPVPYAVIAEMFDYQYRGCALLLATAAACIGNALEVFIFPIVASYGGIATSLGLSSVLTLAYAIFVTLYVPETRGLTPDQIYENMFQKKEKQDCENPQKVEENTYL